MLKDLAPSPHAAYYLCHEPYQKQQAARGFGNNLRTREAEAGGLHIEEGSQEDYVNSL